MARENLFSSEPYGTFFPLPSWTDARWVFPFRLLIGFKEISKGFLKSKYWPKTLLSDISLIRLPFTFGGRSTNGESETMHLTSGLCSFWSAGGGGL
jgi:hypothetical protein